MPAQTSKTPGDGSGTLSYTLASDSFDIESVYAVIDATTATGPVTAELTVRDQSGVVIARKKQAATIPAGQAGSATWALRLDDEGTESAYTTVEDEGVALPTERILNFIGAGVTAADDPANARTTVTIPGGGGGGGIQFDTDPQDGGFLFAHTTGYDPTGPGWGINLVDDGAGSGINLSSGWDVTIDAAHWANLHGAELAEVYSEGHVALSAPLSVNITVDTNNKLLWEPTAGAFTGFMLDATAGYLHMQDNGIRLQAAVGKRVEIIGQGANSEFVTSGFLSLMGGGPAGGVLVQANSNAADGGNGTIMLYNCLAIGGGTFSTFDHPGHFFMLHGGGFGGGSDSTDSYFEVRDYDTTNPLLRIVRAAGGGSFSFHIKTGATWVADL